MGSWRTVLLAMPLAALVSGTGCIKENRDDCPEITRTLVFYYPANGNTDHFSEYIGEVTLFLYDSAEERVDSVLLTGQELARFRGYSPHGLADGKYTVVCWGNAGVYSAFTGTRRLADGTLLQAEYLAGDTVDDFDPLYFGRRDFSLDGSQTSTDTVVFRSAHINMDVHIKGYGDQVATRAQGEGIIRVGNVPAGYDFGMNTVADETVVYPRWENDDSVPEIRSFFRLPRFSDDTGILIDILDSVDCRSIATVVLSDFLAEHGITVEGVNEVTVPVYIFFDGREVRLSVDPWDSRDVEPLSQNRHF